jgi:hypothetical protein
MHPLEDSKSFRLRGVLSIELLHQIHDAFIDERLRFDDVRHGVDSRNGPFERRMLASAFGTDETWVMHALEFRPQRSPMIAFRQRVLVRIDLVYHRWVGEHDRTWTDEHHGTKVSMELLDTAACSALVCIYHLEDVCKTAVLVRCVY